MRRKGEIKRGRQIGRSREREAGVQIETDPERLKDGIMSGH